MKKHKIYLGIHRILVLEKIFESKTKGGIALPDDLVKQYQTMSYEGRIVAMASDAFDFWPEDRRPKIGQVVYFKKYDGEGVEYNKKPYRIILDELINRWTDDFAETEDEIY